MRTWLQTVVRRVRSVASVVSPLGWTFGLTGVIAWGLGAWWGWKELLVAGGVLLVITAVSVFFTIGRLDLQSEIRVDQATVVVGTEADGELLITNRRRRAVRTARYELSVGDGIYVERLHVLANDTMSKPFSIPTDRRAVIPVGPLVTVQGDPLGLFRRTERWADVTDIYVHPATVRLPAVSAGQIRDLEGTTTAAISPSDLAFHTLREYVRGDDLRHVHWRTSAKYAAMAGGGGGQLLVRQYNDTRRSHIAVVLSTDLNEYVSQDEFELAASCAASVAVEVLVGGQEVSVIAGMDELSNSGRKDLLSGFSAIEEAPGKGSLALSLQRVRTVAPGASVVVLCVGSGINLGELQAVISRSALEIETLVIRADEHIKAGFRIIGANRFLDIPRLDDLPPTLSASGTE